MSATSIAAWSETGLSAETDHTLDLTKIDGMDVLPDDLTAYRYLRFQSVATSSYSGNVALYAVPTGGGSDGKEVQLDTTTNENAINVDTLGGPYKSFRMTWDGAGLTGSVKVWAWGRIRR